MAIKFPLEMKDGVQVRNITELKENFDIEKIIGYFLDGKLITWLGARYYEEEAEAVSQLESTDLELAKKLCEILGVEYKYEEEIDAEELTRRNGRIAKLKQFTDKDEIIENIDSVAFNQEELADLYDNKIERIYLCEGEFFIPKSKQDLEYILVGVPKVEGINKDDGKSLNDENKEKHMERTFCSMSRKYNEDYLFDKLADVIGWNNYVVGDNYVVFSSTADSFEDNLPPLDTDENYKDEPGYFRVWDINKKKLSSFKLIGYDNYTNLVAVTDNKIILKKSYNSNDVLVYDIENKKIELTCENWCGNEKSISIANGKIAYIDESKNLYCVDLDTYKKELIDRLDNNNNCILLKETILIYVKEDNIFQYEFFNEEKKLLKELDGSVEELMSYEDRLYIIQMECHKLIILEMNLKDSEKNLKEVFNIEVSFWEKILVKKEPYYILLKEESGYPVFAFNAKLGTVKKILSDCGYTETETHWFKSTDYFHYGYRFCIVGNYFFYNKSKRYSSDKNYFRLNMLTGECRQEKLTND